MPPASFEKDMIGAPGHPYLESPYLEWLSLALPDSRCRNRTPVCAIFAAARPKRRVLFPGKSVVVAFTGPRRAWHAIC